MSWKFGVKRRSFTVLSVRIKRVTVLLLASPAPSAHSRKTLRFRKVSLCRTFAYCIWTSVHAPDTLGHIFYLSDSEKADGLKPVSERKEPAAQMCIRRNSVSAKLFKTGRMWVFWDTTGRRFSNTQPVLA